LRGFFVTPTLVRPRESSTTGEHISFFVLWYEATEKFFRKIFCTINKKVPLVSVKVAPPQRLGLFQGANENPAPLPHRNFRINFQNP